jgi:hypothetical protein
VCALSAVTLLVALGAGTAGPGIAAHASPAQPSAAAAPAATPALITDQQAQQQAETSGSPVVATADSSDVSTTTAQPDGSFVTQVSAQPSQELVNGAWTPVNPALTQNPDGTYSPAVSAQPLVLSGGGGTKLATMTADGRSMTLSWPATLPAPTASGDTLTYANVYPGVNLVVTDDGQGGFSDVLVVQDATAAANPALSSIQLTAATNGLVLSTDSAGDLIASVSSADPPLISFDAPQIWDSAPAPATETTVTNTDGATVDAATGDPASASAAGPGTASNIATIPVSVSGDTVTLTPPASVLTGPSTTYPVYIDPAWHNFASSTPARYTQVFSGLPSDTSLYGKSGDMRVGECPVNYSGYNCNGIGVARSYIQMNLPRQLRAGTDVHAAYLYTTEDWSTSCTAEPVRLWDVSGTIGQGTDWNNAPALSGSYTSQTTAFGYPGCGYYKHDVTFTVTPYIAADAGKQSYQTFALQAGDETANNGNSSQLYWKKFKSSDFVLSVTYNYAPNQPTHLSTNPGGSCHTQQGDPAVIGNDDVTYYSYADDDDGDNALTTTFHVYNTSGTSVFSTTVNTGDRAFAPTTILRAGMQSYGANGSTTAYTYYYQTQVTDDFGLTSPKSDKCWIRYNPKGPQKPTVTLSPSAVTIGGSVAASFTSPNCSSTTSPCPTSYVYQVGAAKPVTETADSSHAWSGNIQVNSIGPIEITVYGVVSGNPGEANTQQVIGTYPTTHYKDGYFTGGSYPDILTTGTSLWLSAGTGNGSVAAPVNVGSIGTGINPGTDGPADWKGAIVAHGDFTGHGVQDVLAYYTSGPHQGNGVIIDGNGNGNVKSLDLAPYSGRTSLLLQGYMQSPALGTTPTDLVGAGNVSGLSTGMDDLIGIATDGSGNGELDLYTNGEGQGAAVSGGYGYYQTLSTTAPDGSTDWGNYSIATAGNPGNTALFAMDNSTGAIYESTAPLTLASSGTWTPLTYNNGNTAQGTLYQGDINNAGQTELWFNGSVGLVSYTLSGTTLTEGNLTSGSRLRNDWQLTDGNDAALGPTATTAVDSLTGTNATLTSGASWDPDSVFGTDASFNGTSGYITPPSSTVSNYPDYLSVWFKTTTTTGGVLVSVQSSPLSSGATTTGTYNPFMYVGNNGLLYAEFWNGSSDPVASTYKVDDGAWHHAVLSSVFIEQKPVCNPTTGNCTACPCPYDAQETLTLDGIQQAVSAATTMESGSWANLTFGAGYIGGTWKNEVDYEKNGNEGYLQYFKGQLADITFSSSLLPLGALLVTAPLDQR